MNNPLLDVRDARANYGSHEVLRGVNLQIARGAWFCLLGPNGVGKSTLLNCITGRLALTGGSIRVGAFSLQTQSIEVRRQLGVAGPPEQLPDLLTGRQCLEVYASARELPCIDAAVLSIADQLRFTPFMERCVDTYSLGTRQKLSVLLALLGNPSLLVLDEAFNGLDPASAVTLKRLLQERLVQSSCAVLLATHSLDIVEHYADAAALMLDGRIARQWSAAEIDELRRDPAGIEGALAAAAAAIDAR